MWFNFFFVRYRECNFDYTMSSQMSVTCSQSGSFSFYLKLPNPQLIFFSLHRLAVVLALIFLLSITGQQNFGF